MELQECIPENVRRVACRLLGKYKIMSTYRNFYTCRMLEKNTILRPLYSFLLNK